jgi:tRNA (mo5U34)-methyltransferase
MPTADQIERAKKLGWYHTLELPGVTTEGLFDMRQFVAEYRLPDSLAGKRVLEVGTWDGFWAFEFERRGAEVVAIDLDDEEDLDWPPRRRTPDPSLVRGVGFRLAKEMLDSKVERVVKSVYDATPEELGTFDMVFCGSVLLHLRDQLLALSRIADLVKPGGVFVSAEEYEPVTDLIPFPVARFRGNRDSAVVFWVPSRRAWRQMLWHSGFDRVQEVKRFTMRANPGWKIRHVVHHAHKN